MLKIFRNLTRKDLLIALLALCFIVAQVWLDLRMPDYMSEITVLVQTPGSAMRDIWIAGGMMLLCAFGSLAAAVCTVVCAAKIASAFSANLRRKLFTRVQMFSMEEIGRFSTASLITRTTNDVMQVQMLIVLGLHILIKSRKRL